MSRVFILNIFCLSLLLQLIWTPDANADWQVVKDFSLSESKPITVADECQYRFRFERKYGTSQVFQHYYAINHFELVKPADGLDIVYSATINHDFLYTLKSTKTFWSENAYTAIEQLFASGRNPFDFRIYLTMNPANGDAVIWLQYHYVNSSGKLTWGFPMLHKEAFALEALCPLPTGLKIVKAEASPSYSSYYTAERMVDGNDNTYWIGQQGAEQYTLLFDLEKISRLSEVEIKWYGDYYTANDVEIAISEDGVNFAVVNDRLIRPNSIKLDNIAAKSVRLILREANFPVIREISIKGTQ